MASNAVEAAKGVVNTITTAVTNTVSGNQEQPEQVHPDESTTLSPKSTEARDKLERQLKERPDRKDLVDKNILKATNVAPALQAAQAELNRARLEDKLDHALQHRPKPEELVKEGILQAEEVPPA
jgi:hypothetical protein